MEEYWREIAGFEDEYLVSNLGKVKNSKTGRILCPWLCNGYAIVALHGVHYRVHRLVAQAFCPNTTIDGVVNHIDGNKLNNSASNLEWVSQKENMRHYYEEIRCLKRKARHQERKVLSVKSGKIYKSYAEAARVENLGSVLLARRSGKLVEL